MVNIRTELSYMIVFVYVSMGMNVSTKWKDNKTVMGHNKHYNRKRNNKEFQSSDRRWVWERRTIERNERTTRRCSLMRRVRTNEEHNKKRSPEVNGVGARPRVVCEVQGHYRSNRSTELTWCCNCNSPH